MSPLIFPCPWYKNGRSSRKVTALHWKADAVSFDQFEKPITPYPQGREAVMQELLPHAPEELAMMALGGRVSSASEQPR